MPNTYASLPAEEGVQVCPACGQTGDGMEGWLADHRILCQEEMVVCPCQLYGCEERMKRRHVKSHLASCAAGTVLCTYSRLHYTRAETSTAGGQGCHGLLRRSDVEQHHFCAHSDTGLIESCPFSPSTAKPNEADGSSAQGSPLHCGQWQRASPWGFPQPASPLHPPNGARTLHPRASGGAFGGGFAFIDRESQRGEGHVREWACEGVCGGCSHQRHAVEPVYERTRAKYRRKDAVPGSIGFLDMAMKADVLGPILASLPARSLRIVACVSRALRESIEGEPSLFSSRNIATLRWEKREIMNSLAGDPKWAQYAPSSRWEAVVEWVRVPPPPPLLSRRYAGGACMSQHLSSCEHKKGAAVRTIEDMAVAAQRLGRVVRLGDDAGSGQPHPPAERREESEGEEEDGAVGEVLGEEGEAELFRAVMDQDVCTMAKLVRGGVNVNAINSGGYTPLGIASERGKTVAVNWLKVYGGRYDASCLTPGHGSS